jgi:hypothetical protein
VIPGGEEKEKRITLEGQRGKDCNAHKFSQITKKTISPHWQRRK